MKQAHSSDRSKSILSNYFGISLLWALGAIALLLTTITNPVQAGSILGSADAAKAYANSKPGFTQWALRKTDLNNWGKCTNVYLATMAMEVRGKQWDDETAATFAFLGEAMSRVRANFLARGYSDDDLGKVLKTYSSRQVDVPDMQFCNTLINDIFTGSQTPENTPAAPPPRLPEAEHGRKPAAKTGAAFAPSFDCSKASQLHERLVCSDRDLAKLDVEASQAYAKARDRRTDKDALKKEQINWIKSSLRSCVDKACLTDVYKKRILELQ